MENQAEIEHKTSPEHLKQTLHSIFAHSYYLYFLLFLIGVTLDLVYPIKIFNAPFMMPLGFLLLIFATIIIFWEIRSPRRLGTEGLTKENFCRGPYCYTRHPAHWGLFLLVMGFGLIANAFFIFFLTIISFVITKLVYIKKHELVLIEKYGTSYEEYKRKVKF